MPWDEAARRQYRRGLERYESEEAERGLLKGLLPPLARIGRPRKMSLREVVNAILYLPAAPLFSPTIHEPPSRSSGSTTGPSESSSFSARNGNRFRINYGRWESRLATHGEPMGRRCSEIRRATSLSETAESSLTMTHSNAHSATFSRLRRSPAILGVCAVERQDTRADGRAGIDARMGRGTGGAQWRTGPSRGAEASGKTPDGSDSGHVSLASRCPYTARSGCRRLMFSARHTRSHSPRALFRPRTLNRRKPRTSSHWAQPLALRVPLPPRWCRQLLDHPVCRRVRVRVAAHCLFPLPPRRHIPVDTPRFELRQVPLIAVAGVRKHRPGLRVEGLLHLIEQPHHLALVARVRCQLRRDNQLMLAIDRHLRVVALLEPLGAGLHDGAVRVGEVALRLVFGFPVSAWLPTPALPRRPRASSASRCAASNRAFAATIAANRSSRRRNSSGNSSPRSDSPKRASSSASVSRACSASISSTPLLRAHPTVAHRLALARVRPNLRPVYRQLPETQKPRLARQMHHLHEQPLELLQVPAAKLAQRAVARKVPRPQHPKRHVLLQLPRHPPQHPRRIPVEQHLDHHPRLIRGVATTVILIRRVERPQIQPVHQVAHVMRKVPFRKPIPHIRRQQQQLVRRGEMSSASLPRLLSTCCRIIFYGAHS